MHTFKDTDGDTWEIRLDIPAVEIIEAATGINLGLPHFGEPPLVVRLSVDAPLVTRLIWYCVHRDAARYRVTDPTEFYDLLEGQTFTAAYAAFIAEYRDFFRRRSIGQIDKRLDQTMEQILQALNFGNQSTNSPESPDLTRANARSDNSPTPPAPAAASTTP